MNPYTRAHVVIPGDLTQPVREALVRNLMRLYNGEPKGHPAHGRFVISTNGQWELEIETNLRSGIEYKGRLSIHCFSPAWQPEAHRRAGRRTHHWH
ncbi:MAG TPA: hypothetical protein VG733_13615 [Chthoniobacteraceae bacterium]|nr:hypothetical protein [Chthoniobacteraceae bacterium]